MSVPVGPSFVGLIGRDFTPDDTGKRALGQPTPENFPSGEAAGVVAELLESVAVVRDVD
jgi:hypothetical protein